MDGFMDPREGMETLKVTVVTQTNCMPCKMTKNLMDTLGIEYTEVDAQSDEALPLLVKHGFKQAPGVVVESNGFTYTWTGFNDEKIKELV